MLGLASCGGQIGGAKSASCGTDFATPNYATDSDPGSGRANQFLHWSGFPLRVGFTGVVTYDPGGASVSSIDVFKDAALKWYHTTSGNVRFEFPDSGSVDITVNIVVLPSAPGPGEQLGATSLSYIPSSGQIVSANMTIYAWNGMTLQQFQDGMKRTAAHEFGHALFLDGHSAREGDLMYFLSDPNVDGWPSSTDINSLYTAYCGTFSTRKPQAEAKEKLETLQISCPTKVQQTANGNKPLVYTP